MRWSRLRLSLLFVNGLLVGRLSNYCRKFRVSRRYPMSWITVLWSMNAAACLTLAGIYLLVWCKQRQNWAHLLFSFTAVAAATIAAFELEMMHAETVGQYEALMRWIHVPVWVLVISFVSFVRLYLHAGRSWLAWSICGLRSRVLILTFVFNAPLKLPQ